MTHILDQGIQYYQTAWLALKSDVVDPEEGAQGGEDNDNVPPGSPGDLS